MKQRMVFGGLWLLAALLAMVVVNQGLDALGAAARSDRVATVPMPVTADVAAGESALAIGEGDDVSGTSTPTTSATDENPPLPTISSSTTTTTATTPTTRPVSTTTPPPVAAAPPPPTIAATPTTIAPIALIAPIAPIAATAYVVEDVGTVWVEFSPTSVIFAGAIPIEPYRFHKEKQIDATTLKLEFKHDDHEVEIIATWLDGPNFTIKDDHD